MLLNKCFPCLHFQNEEVITKLECSNTVLTDIFPDVWQYERTLEELYLTSTRIKKLPPQLFYCQDLRILVVNNNNLESIPNAIGSLRQLHHLNLSRNLISNVPDNIKTCKNLTHLDLSCNNLHRLPDAITCLISLQELLLNETYLEFLPANFGRLVNLKILELRLNSLITLPKSMARLGNLQRIDIGGNEFTELPDIIGELKQLKELWIDFNQIRRMSKNVGKLRDLQHLEANGNLIDTLPNEVSLWRNIEVLSICTNNLESLPFSMGMMKSLVTLKCEHNELCELPDSISYLENLEELVISHNKLLRLPVTIGMLRKLRFLFADDNELRVLPEELCSCSELSVLSISRNKITELPQNIGHLAKLKVLNLVNNYIATLPVTILSLVNLTSLWISDNQSQPLVPLQYVNANTKAQLTCFMLPQVGMRMKQIQEQYGSEITKFNQDDANYACQLRSEQQKEPQLYSSNICTSPSRHICFAEEATILTDVSRGTLNDQGNGVGNAYEPKAMIAAAADVDDHLGARLMRSPTPYPKELRLMAKYVRNGVGKLAHKTRGSLNIKEARVLLNAINCDTNNRTNNNNLQSHIDEDVSFNFESELCGTTLQTETNQQLYGINQHQQQALPLKGINYNQVNYQPELQSLTLDITDCEHNLVTIPQQQFYTSYYLTSTYYNSIYSNNVTPPLNRVQAQQPQKQNIPNYYVSGMNMSINAIPEPPPYHIARVLSRKTPEDLTKFETMRNKHYQQQQIQKQGELRTTFDAQHEIDTTGLNIVVTNDTSSNKSYAGICELNSNCNSYNNTNIITTSSFDNQNNFLNMGSSKRDQKFETLNVAHTSQFQQNGGSLSQLSLCSSASAYISNPKGRLNCVSTPSSSGSGKKRTPWLFGVHKNPTVKQINVKWENHVGFHLKEMPNADGIFVASTIPNTNAARLLSINDKLLEIDGYDLTNIKLSDASKIITNAGSVISIMLSRK